MESGVCYFSQEEHYYTLLICLGAEASDCKVSIGSRQTSLRGLKPLDLSVRPGQPGTVSANDRDRSVHICYVELSPIQPLPTHCEHWGVQKPTYCGGTQKTVIPFGDSSRPIDVLPQRQCSPVVETIGTGLERLSSDHSTVICWLWDLQLNCSASWCQFPHL